MVNSVNAQTVFNWISNEEVILIDVREPGEHASASIEHAMLLPLSRLGGLELPVAEKKKIVIHCQSGKRSLQACKQFMEKYPDLEFYNLEGGILAWEQAGLDVKKSNKVFLPLDRQTQLTIGILLLVGTFLTLFANEYFIALSAFIGMGLCFAGLTGTCGLSMLLAKMPWNQSPTIIKSSFKKGRE